MRPTKCPSCSWPTLGERCIPCRMRADEEVPGHRLIVVESVTISAPELEAIISCPRSGPGCEIQQLPLGEEVPPIEK